MESGQASGQIPPKREEQQAQLDVTCLSLAKGKKEKAHLQEIKGVYMRMPVINDLVVFTEDLLAGVISITNGHSEVGHAALPEFNEYRLEHRIKWILIKVILIDIFCPYRSIDLVAGVNPEAVWDLKFHLDPYRSMGPDGIHLRTLKELANHRMVYIAKASPQEYQSLVAKEKVWRKEDFPLFEEDWIRDHSDKHDMHKSIIFEYSWKTRDVPYDWRKASATPIFLGNSGSYRFSSLI
ncbi:hypothetical protein DUI87_13080 [Hirundo rustica rustica]|uniref:Uncharacterized protein n=1 Tax=Hirundo rustica rustica TaxID=333673 RepID=A0A3M0KAW9_HIRRU|nr:hypothetical protein DUI87_13080 [Hirundo rustica rustica]